MTPEASSRAIQRPVPLRESVYEAILEMIVARTLRPGQHLVENELAVTLGVSRQPVREALQSLKNDGWVDLRPGYGAFVHTPTEREAEQLLTVRGLLETEAARMAASNASTADVDGLRELWRTGVAALDAEDRRAMVDANAAFHARVARASGNDVLVELATQVDRRVRWLYTPVAAQRGGRSWDEHASLIEAIAAGDADRSAEVMAAHTAETRRAYLEQQHDEDSPDDPTLQRAR